ncbi:MAG TPA: DUF2905 domain-containing protein [Candidatus Binatia bacterium]|nr:DUF2905 domain-containing protein [Candidatus Binatia bacterium]
MSDLGRLLIGIGLVLVAVGGVLVVATRLGIPFPLGRLPGDIAVKRDGFSFYFPITTSIVVSLVLSLLFYLLRR